MTDHSHTPEATYEAPAVETVLTPEELERQSHYAGAIGGSQGGAG